MRVRERYEDYVLEARSQARRDVPMFASYVSIEKHTRTVDITELTLKGAYPNEIAAIESALAVGRQTVDFGFRPAHVVIDLSWPE
jgi:hypothetical protein